MSTSSSSSRRRLRLGYAIIPTPQSPPQAAASANLLRQSDSDLAGAGPGGVRDGGVVADTETEPDTDAGAEVEMTDIDWQLQLQLARRPLRRGASGAQQQQQPQQLLRRDRAWNRDRDRDSEDSALRRASSLPMLLLARAHSAAARRSVADIKGQQLAPQSTASLKHPSIPPAPNTLSSHDFDPSAIPVIDDATAQCVLAAYSNDIAHLRRYKTVLLLDSTLDCNIDSVVDAMRNNESFLAEEGDDNDVDNVDEQRVVPLEALSVPLERRAKRIVLNLCSRHLAYLSPNIGFYSSQISQLEM
ncbi:hypothetical protein HDU83_004709 [Entophlyctis luteolus]|nr:hypothetical protein HDU83_004709 [Entophlyctis luteolus]